MKDKCRPVDRRGYTLIELVVVIGVMAVIIGAGMGVFYQSLKSGSKIDFELFMNASNRVIENSMVDTIGFSKVISVEGQDNESCLAAGSSGVLGNNLIVDVGGSLSEYALSDDNITSNSAQINPDGIRVNNLSFRWVCVSGEIEKITVGFVAQAEKDGETVDIERDYSFGVLLKNSGYY
jgi:prepilin-type N-terminal cleavage/methylation domain-containing protein